MDVNGQDRRTGSGRSGGEQSPELPSCVIIPAVVRILLEMHVLQPNQYAYGSKSLSGEERKLAYQPDVRARLVQMGYKVLIEHGAHHAAARAR